MALAAFAAIKSPASRMLLGRSDRCELLRRLCDLPDRRMGVPSLLQFLFVVLDVDGARCAVAGGAGEEGSGVAVIQIILEGTRHGTSPHA